MPTISGFFGILIYMYWRDRSPPHFHAKYGNEKVTVEIISGKVTGTIRLKALDLIQEWRMLPKIELIETWDLAEKKKSLKQIPPLE